MNPARLDFVAADMESKKASVPLVVSHFNSHSVSSHVIFIQLAFFRFT
jgi:hypothetical protein